MTSLRPHERYRLHAEICKVLTEPKRLMLLDALRAGEASVGDLAEAIGVSLPNASQHLAVMRGAGLVDSHRAGTTILYRLAEPAIVDACDLIQRIIDSRVASPFPATSDPAVGSTIPPAQRASSSSASPAGSTPLPAQR